MFRSRPDLQGVKGPIRTMRLPTLSGSEADPIFRGSKAIQDNDCPAGLVQKQTRSSGGQRPRVIATWRGISVQKQTRSSGGQRSVNGPVLRQVWVQKQTRSSGGQRHGPTCFAARGDCSEADPIFRGSKGGIDCVNDERSVQKQTRSSGGQSENLRLRFNVVSSFRSRPDLQGVKARKRFTCA